MADPFTEELPRPKPAMHEIGQDLSMLSVDELAERAEMLRAEIARIETAKAAKLDSRRAAEGFFKM
ncbi:DUF1192 domain-containing protein [Alsobacter sp. SYSU M60028]|uniref:DUF1192 domain-containing protein n=1 Tax=Alsobacter ponti TaxID=2962936 RepID=A0ABT1LGE1_9HYPH|nr:DUF1192 domain-containing protein [Alsobacter ponti]MCP8940168.1 DUF1192 domain-containing protein [Alsobacter ponti]